MGDESIHGEFGLLFLQARWQNYFGIPEKGAECKSPDYASDMACVRGENHDICGGIFLVTSTFSIPLTPRNHVR